MSLTRYSQYKWTDLQSTVIWLGILIGILGLADCSQNLCQIMTALSSDKWTSGQVDNWTNPRPPFQDLTSDNEVINQASFIMAALLHLPRNNAFKWEMSRKKVSNVLSRYTKRGIVLLVWHWQKKKECSLSKPRQTDRQTDIQIAPDDSGH